MRRTARPLRAIDSSSLLCSWRQQSAHSPCPRLGSPAAFSTTLPRSFLLGGTQDKKKHQQFVRRWQKRILGESEPIGARVDPYDPTSPIRIAPEETGEYEEVLDTEELTKRPRPPPFPSYTPAVRSKGLMHVGGEEWQKQKTESQLAREFEKLTERTYTPLTLDMANEIEELTGNPYTLKDENLLMAQTVHEVTGRPYTDYNFGMHKKTLKQNRLPELRRLYTQALAEVYTLKEAGFDMDLSKLVNRGIYDTPQWIDHIQLVKTNSGEPTLAFPRNQSAEEFLQLMQTAPAWESPQAVADVLIDEAEVELNDPAQPLEQISEQTSEPTPVMDPATPTFKRAALVKDDPDWKPFDFMSNRPESRVKAVEEAKAKEESRIKQQALAAVMAKLVSDVDRSGTAVNSLRVEFITHQASQLARDFSDLSLATQKRNSTSSQKTTKKPAVPRPRVEEVMWRQIPIIDDGVKFALFKRLYQLTGIRIADPQLTSATTHGDLYGHLCTAAAPQPATLFSAIHIDGEKALRQAKHHHAAADSKPRTKAHLGDLIRLGNVELRRVKRTKTEERTRTGLDKVVQYALRERGLGGYKPKKLRKSGKKKVQHGVEKRRRDVVFAKPVSSKGASLLAKATARSVEKRRVKEKLKRLL